MMIRSSNRNTPKNYTMTIITKSFLWCFVGSFKSMNRLDTYIFLVLTQDFRKYALTRRPHKFIEV